MEEIKDNLEEKVEKELATKKTEKKKLQWVKGEKAGNVETNVFPSPVFISAMAPL